MNENINKNKPFFLTIKEIQDLLLEKKMIPGNLYANAERKVLLYPNDGDRGIIPTTTPLCISNIITLMISPMGCGIHLTETGRGNFETFDRVWLLRLTEKDIVFGTQEQLILSAISEILESVTFTVEGILICATCSDILLSTDYISISRKVERKFHIRTAVEFMGPLSKTSPKQAEFRMMFAIYSLLRIKENDKTNDTANIIGILNEPLCRAELYQLLYSAGIQQVSCLGDFNSLEHADDMTNSKVNIILDDMACCAVNHIIKKWKGSTVFFRLSYDLDDIIDNYRMLSSALNCKIEDQFLINTIRNKLEILKPKIMKLRCAVGGKNDLPCFVASKNLINMGFNVCSIFAHYITKKDLPEISFLAEKNPNIKVYFDSHPSMYSYKADPEEFNFSFGVPDPFIFDVSQILKAPIIHTGGTYSYLITFLDDIEKIINMPNIVNSGYKVEYMKSWNSLDYKGRI